ncbi:MAG TPA: putative Ig domain-containing protein, partial [Polyangiaceae bacterium]
MMVATAVRCSVDQRDLSGSDGTGGSVGMGTETGTNPPEAGPDVSREAGADVVTAHRSADSGSPAPDADASSSPRDSAPVESSFPDSSLPDTSSPATADARDAPITDGGRDSSAAPPAITTTAIPSAIFEKSFVFTLAATGGAPPYSWSETGPLPAGVSLDANGVLQGTPTAEGDFPFQATVTDNAGLSSSASLSLKVLRKRWLAYAADESPTAPPALYLVDTSNAAYPKTPITLPVGYDLDVYSFSNDGRWFEYTLSDPTFTSQSLYVIDVSGPVAGPSLRIGGPNSVTRPVWSPTIEAFAFGQADADGSSNFLTYYVDLSNGPTFALLPMPGATYGGWWISDDVYVFNGASQIGYVRRTGTSFSTAQLLSFSGIVYSSSADQRKALIGSPRADCATSPTYVVDFNGPSVLTINGTASVSFDFNWLTRANRTDATKTDLFSTSALIASPTA